MKIIIWQLLTEKFIGICQISPCPWYFCKFRRGDETLSVPARFELWSVAKGCPSLTKHEAPLQLVITRHCHFMGPFSSGEVFLNMILGLVKSWRVMLWRIIRTEIISKFYAWVLFLFIFCVIYFWYTEDMSHVLPLSADLW